jgi:hypothetical protein
LRVSNSEVETRFPSRFGDYVRQQARWLRNLLLLGHRFGDRPRVKHALFTMLVGVTMLLALPLALVMRGPMLLVSVLLWSAMAGSRVRYAAFAARARPRAQAAGLWRALPQVMVADVIAWSRVAFDLARPGARSRW